MAGGSSFPAWQERGACRGSFALEFFPPSVGERRDEKRRREFRAKSICAHCTVSGECLAYALTSREIHGVWGGTSELERRRMIGMSA